MLVVLTLHDRESLDFINCCVCIVIPILNLFNHAPTKYPHIVIIKLKLILKLIEIKLKQANPLFLWLKLNLFHNLAVND